MDVVTEQTFENARLKWDSTGLLDLWILLVILSASNLTVSKVALIELYTEEKKSMKVCLLPYKYGGEILWTVTLCLFPSQ